MLCNAGLGEPAALHQRVVEILEKQQKVLAARLRPQRDPLPGDGVCPTHEQYQEVTTKSRDSWQTLLLRAKRDSEPLDMDIQLMELLKNVPAFPKALPKPLSTLANCSLMVECTSEWTTTNNSDCDQPVKIMRHFQILGIPKPVSYYLSDIEDAQSKAQSTEDELFLSLIFAWSYILSALWVEALKSNGLDAQLFHDDISTQNFWECIQKHQWRAVILHDDVLYFSPWSLLRSGERPKYARKLLSPLHCQFCANSSNSDHQIRASSTIQFALQMVADVCTTEALFQESIIALAVVMMLPSRAYNKAVLLPQRSPSILKAGSTATRKSTFYELTSNLDKCMTLSCSPEGIDSLLCSVFFDPAISCNLIGGHMTGTMDALLPLHEGGKTFLRVICNQFSKLAPLWTAAVCIHETELIFGKCAGGTPPLDLPVASWTGVIESFVQVHYSSDGLAADELLRAEEWKNLYLITAERLPPFAPSPPFGKTDESNLNIDIRKHLGHDHQLLLYRMYWILKTGEKVPAHMSYTSMPTADAGIEATCPRSFNVGNRYAIFDRTRKL